MKKLRKIAENLKEIMPSIMLAIILLMIPIMCSVLAQPREHKLDWYDPIDTTWVNFNTVMAHDTLTFSTAEEEYQWLINANNFKKQCLDVLASANEIIEEVLYDDFDCNHKFTIEEIENVLKDKGYYKYAEKLDSLLSTQL